MTLAKNQWHLNLVRKQLHEIRRLRHEGARDVTWSKPLMAPALVLTLMLVAIFIGMTWK